MTKPSFCVVGTQLKQYAQTHKELLMAAGMKNTYAGLTSLLENLDIAKVKA